MVYIFACKAKAVTNAMAGVKRIPKLNLFGFEFRSNLSCAILILVLCVLFLIVKQRIVHSSSGRALMAIRENVVAADGMGINIKKYKIMAFAISAVYTGMAGALYAHIVSYISPESFQSSQSQLLMTMLLFGGMGNLARPHYRSCDCYHTERDASGLFQLQDADLWFHNSGFCAVYAERTVRYCGKIKDYLEEG